MTHTPGPFTIFPSAALAGKQLIAVVHSPCGADLAIGSTSSDVASYQTESNAHLFAASADILAALINLVGNGFSDEELARRWSWSIDAIKAARAAIAKAEGRTA